MSVNLKVLEFSRNRLAARIRRDRLGGGGAYSAPTDP